MEVVVPTTERRWRGGRGRSDRPSYETLGVPKTRSLDVRIVFSSPGPHRDFCPINVRHMILPLWGRGGERDEEATFDVVPEMWSPLRTLLESLLLVGNSFLEIGL